MATKCPQCGVETTVSKENPARPFCSDRCKLIDLNAWLSGTYSITEPIDPENPPDEDGGTRH